VSEDFEARLLEAVYASPDDDAPRQVYADWLQERGDPRGELIALQLANTRTKKAMRRERQLIRHHRASWLGPLWEVVHRGACFGDDRMYDLRFERGFLDEAATSFRTKARVPGIGDPRWSTVRTLLAKDPLLWKPPLPFYTHDVLRRLVHLANAHSDTAIALLEDPRPRRLEVLGVYADPNHAHGERLRGALVDGAGVPALRALKLYCVRETPRAPAPHDYDWLWSSSLGARLDTLTLATGLHEREVAALWPIERAAWLASTWLPPTLQAIRFVQGGTMQTLERRGREWSLGAARPTVGPPDR
jgi:uncharacterized protein (TIGR02996 family)